MYRKLSIITTCLLIALGGCQTSTQRNGSLEQGFLTPPSDMRTGCYWYWVAGDISKEGVIKDLQAMKAAGIDRAFIGHIDGSVLPGHHHVTLFSDEWWDILHAATKTAGELDIEIGMFNCPGWSQAGGPWIEQKQTMRYLASSETRITGGKKVNVKLPEPVPYVVTNWDGHFLNYKSIEDVKVVAVPVSKEYQVNLLDAKGTKINQTVKQFAGNINEVKGKVNNMVPAEKLADAPELSPRYFLPAKHETSIEITLPEAQTARSLYVYPAGRLGCDGELLAKVDGEFKTLRSFKLKRTMFAYNCGFAPYAPVTVSFPETKASEFRIVFTKVNDPCAVGKIVLSPIPVLDAYADKMLGKLYNSNGPSWYEYVFPNSTPTKDGEFATAAQVVDLTDKMTADGTLSWDAPDGEWLVLRTGMVPTGAVNSPATPEATGLEVDKISAAPLNYHFDSFLGKIMERIPAEDRKTFKIVIADSYETGALNWTDDFIEQFKKSYGYDPVPYIPCYSGHIIGSADLSERFLWDVRRLVADRIAYGYMKGLTEVCAKHGLKTWIEDYGDWGFPGEFLMYGGQTAMVGGEFWDNDFSRMDNRSGSSAAHIYNFKECSAESFTGGWNYYMRYPATLKRFGDWAFSEGINQNILHVYVQQADETTWPGRDEWYGQAFNRKNSWFPHLDLFVTYLKRCGFMLQQGLNVADIAFFIGDDTPRNCGARFLDVPAGYEYDFINSEVVIRDMEMKNGLMTLPHGTAYRVLVLPPLETMRPEMLQKLEKLVAEGAVVVGAPPKASPSMKGYPEADKTISDLVAKMWGNDPDAKQRAYGKGQVFNHVSLKEVFDALKVAPDCNLDGNPNILYNHRTLADGTDLYYLTNQSEEPQTFNPVFRAAAGRQPEFWNPVDGSRRNLPAFEDKPDGTLVPITLAKWQSCFIVFQDKGKADGKGVEANFPATKPVVEINGPWTVTFMSDSVHRGPAQPVAFQSLTDWRTDADPAVKYYSGMATYNTVFTLPENTPTDGLILDLGYVGMTAKVKINGTYAGGAWTEPYRLDVASFVKKGENNLEIEVCNTWVNRLIGDAQLPEKERIVDARFTNFDKDEQLQQSGLIGPVRIVISE